MEQTIKVTGEIILGPKTVIRTKPRPVFDQCLLALGFNVKLSRYERIKAENNTLVRQLDIRRGIDEEWKTVEVIAKDPAHIKAYLLAKRLHDSIYPYTKPEPIELTGEIHIPIAAEPYAIVDTLDAFRKAARALGVSVDELIHMCV